VPADLRPRGFVAMDSGTTATLRAVFATARRVAVAGDLGTLLWYEGERFVPAPTTTTASLHGLFGSGPDRLWAVGQGGTVLSYAGAGWTRATVAGADLHGISGAAGRLFLVGGLGTVLSGDGAAFTHQAPLSLADLYGVWAQDRERAWLAGREGTLLHFDGARFVEHDSGTTASLRAIWGAGPSALFAVGQGGTLLHFDGTRWSAAAGPAAGVTLRALFGFSAILHQAD
jgi:hypothetical protein